MAARSMSPVESWTMPRRSTRRLAWVPFPAAGGPNRMMFIALPLSAVGRPRSFDFLISPSYWCASRWDWICATVSIVTDTTIRIEVPPR